VKRLENFPGLHLSYLIDPTAEQAYQICRGNLTGIWPICAGLQQISLQENAKTSLGRSMGRKHTYATKAQLETLVRRMHRAGILYHEALGEFRRHFILVVLRDVNWNKSRAAQALGMHRSTLVRALRELNVDIRALRNADRLPPHSIRTQQQNRNVG
jgi:DNA-binding NtrC family response regulator